MIDWTPYSSPVINGMTNSYSGGSLFLLYGPLQYFATVTASQEAAGYPALRLADRGVSLPWRSTGISGVTITLAFPSAVTAVGVALLGTNLTSAATVLWQTSSDGATWSAGTTSFSARGTRVWSGASQSGKYHRLTISTTVGSYIEVGEVFLAGGLWPGPGLTFADTVQPLKSSQRWIETETSRVETFAGSAIADVRGAREMYNLRYSGLYGAQLSAFRAAHVGRYVVLSPQGQYGRAMFGLWSMGKESLESRVSAEVTFEEVT